VRELRLLTAAGAICRQREIVPARRPVPGHPGAAAARSAAGVLRLLGVRARAARPVAVTEVAVGVEDAEVAVEAAVGGEDAEVAVVAAGKFTMDMELVSRVM
jgi:hypothetical protein